MRCSLHLLMAKNNTSEKNIKEVRIVFMGTPEFAVASLDKLLLAGCNVVGVVTAPDKPAGRGMQLTESAVKKYAVSKGLHILQPEKLKAPQFLNDLKNLKADLQFVVAFRMLPEIVWNMPAFGTINLHGSLLPKYRGAAPINWAIISGEKETGVTTFKLTHEIDTGDILLQEKIAISDDETAGALHDRMKNIGAGLLVRTVTDLIDGTLKELPQEATEAIRHAPRLTNETANIDWEKNAGEIFNLIRGLSPSPTAFTFLNGKKLKIYSSQIEMEVHNFSAGKVFTDGKTYLKFACNDGFIRLKELQLEGKKRMPVEDFLRGYKKPV